MAQTLPTYGPSDLVAEVEQGTWTLKYQLTGILVTCNTWVINNPGQLREPYNRFEAACHTFCRDRSEENRAKLKAAAGKFREALDA